MPRPYSNVRILFVAPYVPSRIRVRPYQVVRELGLRHEVTVLATASSQELEDVSALTGLCQRVELVPLRRGRIIRSCLEAPLHREPFQAAYCRSPELRARLWQLLVDGQFDVVHVEHLRAAHLLDQLVGHPVVYDAVDSISLLLRRTLRGSHSWMQRLVALVELARTRAYERRILERVGVLTVTSHDDASALRALRPRHGGRIEVVPNGVDLAYFHPIEGPVDRSTIVLSGKMSYHANVTAALYFVREVFPRVRARHPEARLRIVGSAPPTELLNLARTPAIEVTGYLADIRPAIASGAVAVCPVTVKVGIQNKILEAMALGVPVVSTAAGAVGLNTRFGTDMLIGRDSDELAQHISAVLGDDSLRRRLALAGRQYVEAHHRWSTVADTFEALYKIARPHRGSFSAPSLG